MLTFVIAGQGGFTIVPGAVDLSSPPPIGNTAPNTISTTTITITEKIVGSGVNAIEFGGNVVINAPSGQQLYLLRRYGGTKVNFGNGADGDSGATVDIAGLGTFVTLIISNAPTSDPHVAGEVWSNLGILTLSAG